MFASETHKGNAAYLKVKYLDFINMIYGRRLQLNVRIIIKVNKQASSHMSGHYTSLSGRKNIFIRLSLML